MLDYEGQTQEAVSALAKWPSDMKNSWNRIKFNLCIFGNFFFEKQFSSAMCDVS